MSFIVLCRPSSNCCKILPFGLPNLLMRITQVMVALADIYKYNFQNLSKPHYL